MIPLLIISEHYCSTTFFPLADTPPECSCPTGLCSKGWLNTCKAVPVCICSSPNNQQFCFCSSWNVSNPLPTHMPAIGFRLLAAIAAPAWEQLCTAHPRKHLKCCFHSSLEGGTVGRIWRSLLSRFLRILKKYSFCNDHNTEIIWLTKCSSSSLLHMLQNTPLALLFLWRMQSIVSTLCYC